MDAQSSRGPGWEGLSQLRDKQQTFLGPVVALKSLQEPGTTGAYRPNSSPPFSLGMAGRVEYVVPWVSALPQRRSSGFQESGG